MINAKCSDDWHTIRMIKSDERVSLHFKPGDEILVILRHACNACVYLYPISSEYYSQLMQENLHFAL